MLLNKLHHNWHKITQVEAEAEERRKPLGSPPSWPKARLQRKRILFSGSAF
jgi:hypothetical protein